MRYKRANIDSLNLSDSHIESIFIHNEDYIIETVKNRTTFNPKVWRESFGKSLTRNITEAKIIHTYLGLKIPLKTFAVSPKSQTLEFAGLYGYNERSQLLVQTLRELKSQLQYTRVMRIDIAIDYTNGIPKRVISNLKKNREPFQWKNSTYWKTQGEKRTNRIMDIVTYDKSLHATLDYQVHRLEFRFKSGYLKKLTFRDIEEVYQIMEKTIKKFAGITVKVSPIVD